jgi:hypothetical protein
MAQEITDRTACLGIFDSNAPDYVRPEERIQFEQFLDRLPGPYFVVIDDDQLGRASIGPLPT